MIRWNWKGEELHFFLKNNRKAFFFFFFFVFLGLHLQHMEFLRLGVKSELQLLAYTTDTATPDPSHVCDLHHGSWQHWILNPLSEAKDRTHILLAASRLCCPWAATGTPSFCISMILRWTCSLVTNHCLMCPFQWWEAVSWAGKKTSQFKVEELSLFIPMSFSIQTL